jgi:hypothetical protein
MNWFLLCLHNLDKLAYLFDAEAVGVLGAESKDEPIHLPQGRLQVVGS